MFFISSPFPVSFIYFKVKQKLFDRQRDLAKSHRTE